MFGIFISIAMWWVYFDFISHRLPIQTKQKRFGWLYLHLPVTMAIAFVGASLLNILEHYKPSDVLSSVDTWLMVLPVSAFLWSVVALSNTIAINPEDSEVERRGMLSASISGALILLVGFMPVTVIGLLLLVCLFLIFPVWSAFRVWIKRMHRRQLEGQQELPFIK